MAPSSEDMSSSTPAKPISILFVCMGNICRSPMAEAVFAHLTSNNPAIGKTDSCGTGAWHVGSDPDSRTQAVLQKHGITDYTHDARKVRPEDFHNFDWVMAMDSDNLSDLKRMRARAKTKLMEKEGKGEEGLAQLCMFGDFGKKDMRGRGEEVIDPYYGYDDGFEVAYEQMDRFTKGFLEHIGGSEKNEKL